MLSQTSSPGLRPTGHLSREGLPVTRHKLTEFFVSYSNVSNIETGGVWVRDARCELRREDKLKKASSDIP